MGTRLYFAFYELKDDAMFDERMTMLCNEIGSRGRPPEGDPSSAAGGVAVAAAAHNIVVTRPSAPAPAPAAARVATTTAPAPAPDRGALAPAVTPDRRFTPSAGIQMSSPTEHSDVGPGTLAEMAALIREIQRETKEAVRAELAAAVPKALISAEQLASLQARLEAVSAAGLLSEEESFALGDICGDYLELQAGTQTVLTKEVVYSASGNGFGAAVKLAKMIGLSAGIAADENFVRQVRRLCLR